MAAAVDQVCRPGRSDLGVVERLKHRVDVVREVFGVHPVDGVGQRAQHAVLPARREARAVLDVASLLAVIPVHARDVVLVGPDAGRDRRRAHGRHRRERGDAVVDVDAFVPDQLERRRAAGGDRALEHLRLERVDHDENQLLGLAGAEHLFEDPQAGVLLTLAPTPGEQQPQQRARPIGPTGGASTDSAANRTATPPRRRATRRTVVSSSRPRARANSGRVAASPISAQITPPTYPGQTA